MIRSHSILPIVLPIIPVYVSPQQGMHHRTVALQFLLPHSQAHQHNACATPDSKEARTRRDSSVSGNDMNVVNRAFRIRISTTAQPITEGSLQAAINPAVIAAKKADISEKQNSLNGN